MSFEAPEGWRASTLGELAENDDRLRVPLSSQERSLRQGPYPYWGANGVLDYVDEYLFDEPRVLVAEDGTVRTDDGFPVVHRPVGRYWVNNHAHVLRAKWGVDSAWFFYAISRTPVDPFLTGSVQLKLSQANMNLMPLIVPPLVEQRRIAWVLGTLDDKIELNRKLYGTRVQVFRTLSSELLGGESHEGSLGDYFKITVGGIWGDESKGSERTEQVRVLRGVDIAELAAAGDPQVPLRWLKPSERDKRLLNAGDIVIEGSGECGRSLCWLDEFGSLNPEPTVFTNFCKRIRTDHGVGMALAVWVQFLEMKEHGRIDDYITGTAMPNLDLKGLMKHLNVRIPSAESSARLESIGKALLSPEPLVENRRLMALRDELLPKLISGKIRVPEGVGPDLDDETAQEVAEELTEA